MAGFLFCRRAGAAALALALLGGASGARLEAQPVLSPGSGARPPAAAPADPQGDIRRSSDFLADLAQNLLDSVVNISTSQQLSASRSDPIPDVPESAPHRDFFDEFHERQRRGDNLRRVQSLGSGFIVDPQGIIITNNHVIADADEIVARLHDGTKLAAQVVGRDPQTDIAVLQVKPVKPLKAVKFADSDKLRVGNWVMAIGNPFGLGGSVTIGIVSARNRDINSGPFDDFIQTDAAINRGNSGGPLFNLDGDVVGINTAIFSPTGGSVGVGFAVPSNMASSVVNQLRTFGETKRGWLGVRIQEVTEDIADSLSMEKAHGALVSAVNPDGPAAKAGIRQGDVVISFDGEKIAELRDLPRIVAETPPGKEVEVVVVRGGEEKRFVIPIGRLEDREAAAGGPDGGDKEAAPANILGLSLSPINDDLRERFMIDDKVEGVVVTDVDSSSKAAERDFAPGDTIVEAAQRRVSAPGDISRRVEELRKQGRSTILFLVADPSGERRFVALPLDE